MAVNNTNAFSGPFAANGNTKTFPFTFAARSAAEVMVLLRRAVGSDIVVYGELYTVTLNVNGNGGSVTFATPPSGGAILLVSHPDFTQQILFELESSFLPTTHNLALDQAAIRDIWLRAEIARSLKVPVGEIVNDLPTAPQRANKLLGFDEFGQPVMRTGGVVPSGPAQVTPQQAIIDAPHLVQSFVGDFPIIGGEDKAPQGMAWVRIDGEAFLIKKQRVNLDLGDINTDFDEDGVPEVVFGPDGEIIEGVEVDVGSEFHRIVQVRYPSMEVVAQTTPLPYSHQGIGAYVRDGKLRILNAGHRATSNFGVPNGKGFVETEWKGAATSIADITGYQVFGSYGSGHEFEQFWAGQAFDDPAGTRWGLVAQDRQQPMRIDAGSWVFIYDAAEVVAAGNDATKVKPLHGPWQLRPEPTFEGNCWQDWAILGDYLYAYIGRPHPMFHSYVQIYKLDGTHIRTIAFLGHKAVYGSEGLKDFAGAFPGLADRGIIYSLEAEGMVVTDTGEILLLHTDKSGASSPDVVTYLCGDGITRRYTPVTSAVTFTGYPPASAAWCETTKPATRGAWDRTATYHGHGAKNASFQRVWRIGLPTGASGEYPCGRSSVGTSRAGGAVNLGDDGRIKYNYAYPPKFVKSKELAHTDLDRMVFGDQAIDFYDVSEGADRGWKTRVFSVSNGGRQGWALMLDGPSTRNGAYLYGSGPDDSVNPGGWGVRLDTGSTYDAVKSSVNGDVRFYARSGYTPLSSERPDTGAVWEGYRGGILKASISPSTANTRFVAEGGNTLILATRAAPGDASSDHWEISATTGAFVPVGTKNIGTASASVANLYTATGTVSTSDARLKTAVQPLTEGEIEAAKALGAEIGTFRFLAAIDEKGDAARFHVGMTVQRAIEIMEDFGLDPTAYGFICHDVWEATENEDGQRPAGDRYSFRADELLLFMARGFEARLAALEAPD